MDRTSGKPWQSEGLECANLLDGSEPRATHRSQNSAGTSGHRTSAQALARDLQRPLEEVALLYCKELSYLRKEAKVLDFLPVLISKRLRALYKERPPSRAPAL